MLIARRSPMTGGINQMEMPVTQEEIDSWVNSNQLIQRVLPQLNADQREFLITGYTPEDWEAMNKACNEEPDDNDDGGSF